MAGITRLGLDGYQTQVTGSFAGKPAFTPPVPPLTRMSLDGYMTQRTGDFTGKPLTEALEGGSLVIRRRRRKSAS